MTMQNPVPTAAVEEAKATPMTAKVASEPAQAQDNESNDADKAALHEDNSASTSTSRQADVRPSLPSQSAFKASDQNPNYFGTAQVWQKYHDVRPAYPKELFEIIFQYHEDNGGCFNLAADFGSGPGTIVPDLLKRFKRVEASDLNEWQVKTGREHLQREYGPARVGFHTGAAGECTWIQDGTADLFIAAEAAQWFDMEKWSKEAAAKLRPGGTVAMVYYSCNATIVDPPEAAYHCNKLFSLLFETTWAQIGTPKTALLPHVTKFNSVGLSSESFDQSKEIRHYWDLPGIVAGPYGLGENPPSSRAIFSEVPDHSKHAKKFTHFAANGTTCFLMRQGWTADDLLEYIKSLGMPMDNLTGHKEYSETMTQLKNVVKEKKQDGKFTAGWWCTLVLASKKKQ